MGMAREAFTMSQWGKSNIHLLNPLEVSILAIWAYQSPVLLLNGKVLYLVGEKWGNVRICL
jgi:hypothetical protein